MSEYVALEKLINAPPALPERDVECPLLGGKVRVRGCTVGQRTKWERTIQGRTADEIRQRLVVASVVKPEGLTQQHIAAIANHDARAIEPIVDAAMQLWGFKGGDLEALEKNSEATANSGG